MIDEPLSSFVRGEVLRKFARDRVWEIESENPVSPLPPWVDRWFFEFRDAVARAEEDSLGRYVEVEARSAAEHYRAYGDFPDGFFDDEWVDNVLSRVDEILGDESPVVLFTLDDVDEDSVGYPNADGTAAALQAAAVAGRVPSPSQLSDASDCPPGPSFTESATRVPREEPAALVRQRAGASPESAGAPPQVGGQGGTQGHPQLIPCLVACALLFFALGDQPYGYFTVLRWVVTIAAAISAYVGFKAANIFAAWVFVAMAVLFNPIAPVFLERSTWQTMDMIGAAILIYAATLRMPLPTTGQIRAPVNGA